jgi:hypothetical protein
VADFSKLMKAQTISAASEREYVFTDLEGEPSIWVSPAADDNVDYLNARLEEALAETDTGDEADKKPKPKRNAKTTPEDLKRQFAESKELDCKLISRACARRWGTAPETSEGVPAEFNAENVFDFLMQLPDHLITPFRNFVYNVRNFTDREKPDGRKMGKS